MKLTTDDIRLLLSATNTIIEAKKDHIKFLKKWQKESAIPYYYDSQINEEKEIITSFKKLNNKLVRCL